MHWVTAYLIKRYVDGGRGHNGGYDCWGIVREARAAHCGKRLLPELGGLDALDPRQITKAYNAEAPQMELCEPEHGAIAAVLHGRVCVHVALVVDVQGEHWILETNPKRGARFIRLARWQREHNCVTYHRDVK